jgi:hypothetical protein
MRLWRAAADPDDKQMNLHKQCKENWLGNPEVLGTRHLQLPRLQLISSYGLKQMRSNYIKSSLPPWSTDPSLEATFHLKLNLFTAFYGTRRFLYPLAPICPALCHNETVHTPHPMSERSLLILSYHLRHVCKIMFFLQVSPSNPARTTHLPLTCHTTSPSLSSLFNNKSTNKLVKKWETRLSLTVKFRLRSSVMLRPVEY